MPQKEGSGSVFRKPWSNAISLPHAHIFPGLFLLFLNALLLQSESFLTTFYAAKHAKTIVAETVINTVQQFTTSFKVRPQQI